VRAIYEKGWFGDRRLERSYLGDDHLLGLVTVAAGFRLADLGGPDGPMALRWQGLPAHPAELLAAGKALTHSVRSWQNLTEPEIRAFFAQSRATSQRAG
jgi:type II secretory pathway component PulM